VPLKSLQLQEEGLVLGQKVRSFGLAVAKLLIKYKEDIIEHQLQLDRIATSAMALYTTTATLSYLDAEIQTGSKNLKNDSATAKLYCALAFNTIDRQLASISDNCDSAIENLSDQLTEANL
jgi:hypothetical protein